MADDHYPTDAERLPGDALAAMASTRRQHVAGALADAGDGIERLDDVVDAVGERFDDTDEDELRAALHHVHLPKLDDAGLVDYDPDGHVVEPEGEKLSALLDRLTVRPE